MGKHKFAFAFSDIPPFLFLLFHRFPPNCPPKIWSRPLFSTPPRPVQGPAELNQDFTGTYEYLVSHPWKYELITRRSMKRLSNMQMINRTYATGFKMFLNAQSPYESVERPCWIPDMCMHSMENLKERNKNLCKLFEIHQTLMKLIIWSPDRIQYC